MRCFNRDDATITSGGDMSPCSAGRMPSPVSRVVNKAPRARAELVVAPNEKKCRETCACLSPNMFFRLRLRRAICRCHSPIKQEPLGIDEKARMRWAVIRTGQACQMIMWHAKRRGTERSPRCGAQRKSVPRKSGDTVPISKAGDTMNRWTPS